MALDRPVYSTPPPVESTPQNNECRLVDVHGHKIAAFTINHDEYICLPQVSYLFQKLESDMIPAFPFQNQLISKIFSCSKKKTWWLASRKVPSVISVLGWELESYTGSRSKTVSEIESQGRYAFLFSKLSFLTLWSFDRKRTHTDKHLKLFITRDPSISMASCHYQHKTKFLGFRPLSEASRRRSSYSLHKAEASFNYSFGVQCWTGETLFVTISSITKIGLSQRARGTWTDEMKLILSICLCYAGAHCETRSIFYMFWCFKARRFYQIIFIGAHTPRPRCNSTRCQSL